MPWYSAGTVTVTNNSGTVTGTGTSFSANARVGDAFRGPDGFWYEVTNVSSATVLSIKPNYQGANSPTGSYAIAPMQGYVKDSADALRGFVNQYGALLASLGPVASWQSGSPFVLAGQGVRIQADFSSSPIANRGAFQSSVKDGSTVVLVIPNGSATNSAFLAANSFDPNNASYIQISAQAAATLIQSGATGSGSQLPIDVNVNGTNRARFATSGTFMLGSTNEHPIAAGSPGLSVQAVGSLILRSNSLSTWPMQVGIPAGGAGTVSAFYSGPTQVGSITTSGTTTSYNTSSDYRLKENVLDLDEIEATARIMEFRPVTWNWKADGSEGKGFIAHENQAVDPDTATGTKDAVRRVGSVQLPDGTLVAEGVVEPDDVSIYGDGAMWAFTQEQPVYQGRDDTKMIPDMIAMLHKMRRELDEARAEIALLKSA